MTSAPSSSLPRRRLRSGLVLLLHGEIPQGRQGDRADTEKSHENLHFPRDSSSGNGMFWKRAGISDYLESTDAMSPGYRRNDGYSVGSSLRGMVDSGGSFLTGMADKGPIMGALGYALPGAALGGIGGLAYDSFFKGDREGPKTGLSTVLGAAIGAGLGGLSGYSRSQSYADELAAQDMLAAYEERIRRNHASGVGVTPVTQ